MINSPKNTTHESKGNSDETKGTSTSSVKKNVSNFLKMTFSKRTDNTEKDIKMLWFLQAKSWLLFSAKTLLQLY